MDRGSTPSGPDKPGRHERAAHVEGHHPNIPGPAKPVHDADERIIVGLLPALASLTAPDPRAKDRMRQRILAGLKPDSVATTAVRRPATAPSPRRPRAPRDRPSGATKGSRGPGDPQKGMASARGRFAIASVALLALVFSLAGMSLLLARDALPGDALYGIKRTAEAASLGLTFGDESKALKHLEFASARVNEIETLAQRYPNPSSAPVGGYLTALTDFDNDASAGSRQLIALATRNDGRQLESLWAWSDQQAERLDAVAPRLPGPAHNRQGASTALLSKIASRSAALLARMACYQITTGSFDNVGALPATSVCERVPGAASTDPPLSNPGGVAPADPTAPALTTVPQPAERQPQPGQQVPGQPAPSEPGAGTAPPTGERSEVPALPGVPDPAQPPLNVPLPLPTIDLPPLLPGLPGIRIGG